MNKYEATFACLLVLAITAVCLGVIGCQVHENRMYREGGYCGQAAWVKCADMRPISQPPVLVAPR